MSWKRLDRKTIYETKYLKVYEDKIELPNGNIHENYSVVKFPDIVVIVATTKDGQIITLNEYKYGPDDVMRSFPAGHIEEGEDIVVAAKRELLEETGFGEGDLKYLGTVWEFSTKNLGKVHVVSAENVVKLEEQNLDVNEEVEPVLISKEQLYKEIENGQWQLSSPLAAITITGLLKS